MSPAIEQAVRGASVLLNARSVVVIGASDNEAKVGARPAVILDRLGFTGSVYQINRSGGPGFHASLADLPETPDLAVVCLPAAAATEAVRTCAEAGVSAAVVFSNGFAESGDTALQDELRAATRGTLRLLGPNCLGFADFTTGVAGTFSSYLLKRRIRPGNVTLISQSGALGNALMLAFESLQVDLRAWVATGNEVDLTISDFLEAFLDDDETHTIVACVESLRDGERWVPLARRAAAAGKRILVVKGGLSSRSRSLALSHSGKMLGSYALWDEFTRDLGIVSVESIGELADVAHVADCLARAGAGPSSAGLGVVTSSGGLGVLLSDAGERHGVRFADLQPGTTADLVALLPAGASVQNPVDPTPVTDEVYCGAGRILADDPDVGVVLVILQSLSRDYATVADRIVSLADHAAAVGTVVAVSYLAESDALPAEVEASLRRRGVVVLPSPDRVVRALGLLAGRRGTATEPHTGPATESAAMTWWDVAPWLERAQLPVVPWAAAPTAQAAVDFLAEFGGPIVMKIDDPAIGHKSDVGGVVLGISDAAGATAAHADLRRLGTGVVAQRQAEPGLEAIVSVRRDAELGGFCSVGWGGVYADLMADLVSAPCPLSAADAHRLLARSTLGRVVAGFRGDEGYDAEAFVQLLVDLTTAFAAQSEFTEVELNPVRILRPGRGCVVVDALVPLW